MNNLILLGFASTQEHLFFWDTLEKARSHKYIKRIPYTDSKGKRRYKYFYKEKHTDQIVTKDALVVGASFAYGEHDSKGHYHVTHVSGDQITIRHDETNETRTVSAEILRSLLKDVSSHDLSSAKATKTRDLLLQTAHTGSEKQFARMLSLAENFLSLHEDTIAQTTVKDAIQEALRLRKERAQEKSKQQERKPSIDASFGGKVGAKTHVFYSGPNGQPVALDGEYRVVEASTLVPSHDPTSFSKNEKYPKGLQERAYHSDPAEKSKVRTNAKNMHPALVINTNPDALNGPPILNEEGIVLGGNSRAMSLQLVHSQHKEKAQQMKDFLKQNAYQVGLKEQDIDAFEHPVLVRVIKTKDQDQHLLVRAMNEGFTQGLDPRTMMVAMSRRLDERALKELSNSMTKDQTLSAFLDSPASKDFVSELSRVGIIDSRNKNQYTNKRTGRLNEDGKLLVERVLMGKVLPDADLLSNTKASMISALAGVVPSLIQAEKYGEGYSLRQNLKDALSAYNKMHDLDIAPPRSATGRDLDFAVNQAKRSMDDMFEGVHPINSDKRSEALFDLLVKRGGPRQLSEAFRAYAKAAKEHPEGQESLFGKTTAEEVFNSIFKQQETSSRQSAGQQTSLFLSLHGKAVKTNGQIRKGFSVVVA